MSFTKLPAIKGSVACLTCGCGAHETFAPDDLITVGFGAAFVTRNGEYVYDENTEVYAAKREKREAVFWEGKDAEERAAQSPDDDWKIHLIAPLYEAVYQRQGANHWVLVEKGLGFA